MTQLQHVVQLHTEVAFAELESLHLFDLFDFLLQCPTSVVGRMFPKTIDTAASQVFRPELGSDF